MQYRCNLYILISILNNHTLGFEEEKLRYTKLKFRVHTSFYIDGYAVVEHFTG
jgi:hypothetical protein